MEVGDEVREGGRKVRLEKERVREQGRRKEEGQR